MTYLLKKGNLVFKTIHDTGCVDIVAIDKRGNIHLYDVKTSLKYAKGKKKGQNINRVLTPLQKKARDPLPKTLKLFSGSIVRDPSSISEKHPLCSIGPGSKSQGWEQLLLMLGAWTPDGRSSTKLH
jgi:hypothetical protein